MIKEIIEYERKKRGITIYELSCMAYIPYGTLKSRLAHEDSWKWGEIKSVAQVFKLTPNELIKKGERI